MKFLEKIENLINKVLLFLGALFVRGLVKILPAKVLAFFSKLESFWGRFLQFLKDLPKLSLVWGKNSAGKFKAFLAAHDYKKMLKDTYAVAMKAQAPLTSGKATSKLKTALAAPFVLFNHWVKGLSMTQTLLLIGFTSLSFLAIVGIGFSGKRLADSHTEVNRAPASIEEVEAYDRPKYYKENSRHFQLGSLRLPVYFSKVNELKSVDIDFTATVSNRMARKKLEKLEFKLRDHFVLEVEPVIATFPLEEEGKEVIRRKLLLEIEAFMKLQEVEGTVENLEITYILAN